MGPKLEGSLSLDGLVEGRLPAAPDSAERIRQWVGFAASSGLRFTLEVDGGRFSLLPDERTLLARELPGDARSLIRDTLGQLLEAFEPTERSGVFSTLRSREYEPGLEIQRIYAIAPDGTVSAQERTVQATTRAPERPLGKREKLRLALIGVVVLAAIFGILSVFLDWRDLFSGVAQATGTLESVEPDVDLGDYSDLFEVSEVRLDWGKGELLAVLRRRAAYPRSRLDYERLLQDTSADWLGRMRVEGLARGYVPAEVFDRSHQLLGWELVCVKELERRERTLVAVRLRRKGIPRRIVFGTRLPVPGKGEKR